ncbi:predicted protein [Lichtheimia corymbifera JMRC:FSU:9682]|uniref:Uncharacterized protein n=1 Tax=Lichtheimia corymbifera JMRC:FSU:9682 TaxID=1263082 RepID=A0A068REJ5_9FUNG|nr:predicted protein [Lichtheimia corymbifera JMRC:FSU:9682]
MDTTGRCSLCLVFALLAGPIWFRHSRIAALKSGVTGYLSAALDVSLSPFFGHWLSAAVPVVMRAWPRRISLMGTSHQQSLMSRLASLQ